MAKGLFRGWGIGTWRCCKVAQRKRATIGSTLSRFHSRKKMARQGRAILVLAPRSIEGYALM